MFINKTGIASAVMLAMVTSASTFAAEKVPVIGVVAIDLQNSFFVRMRQAGDEAAKDYGVKVIWQGSEGSLEKEISNIENFVNQSVDVILVDPLDRAAIANAVQKAKAKNIPVVAMGNKVDGNWNYNTLYPDYSNMSTVARALGKKLDGKGEVALLIGGKGNYVSDTREKAFRDVMAKEFPGIKLVGVEATNWDSTRSSDAMQTWLSTYPNLKGVGCFADSICVAAKTIADANGRNISFASYEGDPEMFPYVSDGSNVVDVLNGASRVGYWNIAVAARLAKGAKYPTDLFMPTYFVTSDKTAAELKARGLSFPYITPAKAEVVAKDYRTEMAPSKPDSAMTVSEK
ncbi:sugar ABC transporter substrate-binding protein [[Enterobacter] lignolyticus]|uniref:LacI family transcriptional regulator n=1 Tax=[Enterobacter] lignolyticus TaxID=1334193 RepID=A0A806XH38_9ENTR|nr:sugar ABC transporter substrate-binding protein [[Enterobacter] lignolyticus]ALR78049.1 LacI family transcriptional regulator [[Enterobacter] lignolyticus]